MLSNPMPVDAANPRSQVGDRTRNWRGLLLLFVRRLTVRNNCLTSRLHVAVYLGLDPADGIPHSRNLPFRFHSISLGPRCAFSLHWCLFLDNHRQPGL